MTATAIFFRTLKDCALPNMVRLQKDCREVGIEVTYTIVESLTADGRDRSPDYKITGFNVPKGSSDANMVKELAPTDDKIVFRKLPRTCLYPPTSIMYCAISV